MIDIKFLRENPDVVKQNIKNKFQDRKLPLVDEVIELDAQARTTKTEADELRANRNKLSKEIGALMAQGKKDEAMAIRWHMGEFGDKNSNTISQAYDKYPLAVKLHLADLESTFLREKGTSQVNNR